MADVLKNTVLFITEGDKVLLGMKKRGFGAGWWNGYGGKLDPGESFDDCIRRETIEESTLDVTDVKRVARLLFYFEGKLSIACLAYVSDSYTGTPAETEEMKPQWFNRRELPFDTMWPGDEAWIPQALDPNLDHILNFAVYFKANDEYDYIESLTDEAVRKYFED